MHDWGIAAHPVVSMEVRGFAYKLEAQRQYSTFETLNPMTQIMSRLYRLMEGQLGFNQDLDEDDNAKCCICNWNAEHLIPLAVNSTVAKFRHLHGPLN